MLVPTKGVWPQYQGNEQATFVQYCNPTYIFQRGSVRALARSIGGIA